MLLATSFFQHAACNLATAGYHNGLTATCRGRESAPSTSFPSSQLASMMLFQINLASLSLKGDSSRQILAIGFSLHRDQKGQRITRIV